MSLDALVGEEITEEELRSISNKFESASPQEVLRWASDEFAPDFALATGFGAEGCVLIAMLSTIGSIKFPQIFYLDTDLLFPETYKLRDRLVARYGVHIERRTTTVSLDSQAAEYGERLWERDPDLCCRLRKVTPLRESLKGMQAWVTALRRDQSPTRAGINVVERDSNFGLIKINPLARWTAREVWNYIIKHDVPYNPLHDRGYPSIGCLPCTTCVQVGEGERAGRWRGSGKSECGIHDRGQS
jgi:phosphoadenosine phosphosulfate reductase